MADQRISWASHRFIAVLMVVLVGVGCFFAFHTARQSQKCIVITGISSTGKSSAADALKKMLGRDCTIVRLDDYIQTMVETKARECSWNERMAVSPMEFLRLKYEQDQGRVTFDYEVRADLLDYEPLYDAIRMARESHRFVIVDTAVESARCRKELEQVVGAQNSCWVLLYCPFKVVAQRLLDRSNMASFANLGISLATYESFFAMYTNKKGEHWTPVDTVDAHETRMLLDASINEMLSRVPYDKVVDSKHRADAFRRRFLADLGLDHDLHAAVPLYPLERYDLVLNSAAASPEATAQAINQKLS